MSKTRLYVGGLPFRIDERVVEDIFARYGKVMRCDLKEGFAFIEFEDPRDADDAVKALDGTMLEGMKIRVEPSHGPRKFFDGGSGGAPGRSDYRILIDHLGKRTTWQQLKDHFRRVGEVLFADVIHDRDGRSKGCGTIEFKEYEDMKRAMRELNGTVLDGVRIVIREDIQNRDTARPRDRSLSPERNRNRDRDSRFRERERERDHNSDTGSSSGRYAAAAAASTTQDRKRRSRSRSPPYSSHNNGHRVSSPPIRGRSPKRARSRSPIAGITTNGGAPAPK